MLFASVFRKHKARFARYKFDIFGWLLLSPAFYRNVYPIVHGSRPTAVRLVMNIFRSFYLSYIRELYINLSMRLLLGGSSFDSVPAYPNHFQQVLISSRSCALIRFCGIILISMPIGHWMRTIFGFAGIVTDSFSFANASNSGFFHARTLLSCCLDPLNTISMFHGWISRG